MIDSGQNGTYLTNLWQNVLSYINENKLVQEDYLNFIRLDNTKIYSIDDEEDRIIISCNEFVTATFVNVLKQAFENTFLSILGKQYAVVGKTDEDLNSGVKADVVVKESFIKTQLDRNYTFENFVVGRSNIQSHVAATTVSTNPGLVYNPLFIYGNSGLGKSHLLNAIGNHIKKTFPSYKIGIISGLDFVEGVFESIKAHRIDEFKREFYDLDVLLVDDIQFIAGKEKTHEIFFSIFNELVNNKKQICLTSDRMPNEIKGLEERIISRFNQGLNVNIEAPEYETSINILKMKMSATTISTQEIDDEALSFLATNFSQDVRTLEGALNRLLFYSINFKPNEKITLKLATEAFKDQIGETVDNEVGIDDIKKAVCDFYGVTNQQINSKIRTKKIAMPRQIAMYLIRKYLDLPYKEIGLAFGKRDHSTVINACERVEKNIKKDPSYLKAIQQLEEIIKH